MTRALVLSSTAQRQGIDSLGISSYQACAYHCNTHLLSLSTSLVNLNPQNCNRAEFEEGEADSAKLHHRSTCSHRSSCQDPTSQVPNRILLSRSLLCNRLKRVVETVSEYQPSNATQTKSASFIATTRKQRKVNKNFPLQTMAAFTDSNRI